MDGLYVLDELDRITDSSDRFCLIIRNFDIEFLFKFVKIRIIIT